MQNDKPYILFCAGEDSGDCIGQSLVQEVSELLPQVDLLGSGGPRMQSAGLKPIVDFEILPVSGFGDVIPKYLKLRSCYNVLRKTLMSPQCLALVAIDYPGFNMKLAALASKLGKPTLYVAPPQVWAWKSKRARLLAKLSKVKLAVFFDFEKAVYESAGCDVELVAHPFVEMAEQNKSGINATPKTPSNELLLLPGSRLRQSMRNLPVFLEIAQRFVELQHCSVSLLAARKTVAGQMNLFLDRFVLDEFRSRIHVKVSPQEEVNRLLMYRNAVAAITAPGTSTLELAVSGCPSVVCTKPDALTYHLAKRFVKTRFFALPSIILDKMVYPEFLQMDFSREDCKNIADTMNNSRSDFSAAELVDRLASGRKTFELVSEFLTQFVKSQAK